MFMFCTLIKDSVLCTSNRITIGNDVEGSGIKVDPSTGHEGLLGDGGNVAIFLNLGCRWR